MEQETKLGYYGNMPKFYYHYRKEGHHLEPITFYLADLDKKI